MNKKDIFTDAIGNADEKFIEETLLRREARKRRRALCRTWGTAAACALIVACGAAIAIPALKGKEAPKPIPPEVVDTSGVDTSASDAAATTVTEADPGLPKIIFAGKDPANADTSAEISTETEDAVIKDYSEKRWVYFDQALEDALKNAADSDIFAFAVNVFGDFFFPDEITKEFELVEGRFMDAARSVTERIAAERGIGMNEAAARKFSDPEFIAARETFHAGIKAYEAAWLAALAENRRAGIDAISDHVTGIFCDYTDEEYQHYLYLKSASCIMTATKSQLKALADMEFGSMYYTFRAASENSKNLPISDFYTGSEVELPEDGKITKAALAELEKAGSIKVFCVAEYSGPEYLTREEIDAAALAAIGMTAEEFESMADNDHDLVDRYIAARNDVIYNSSFYKSLTERLLLPGELSEIEAWRGGFTAELTRDRAEEISRDPEIAYIRLPEPEPVTDAAYVTYATDIAIE